MTVNFTAALKKAESIWRAEPNCVGGPYNAMELAASAVLGEMDDNTLATLLATTPIVLAAKLDLSNTIFNDPPKTLREAILQVLTRRLVTCFDITYLDASVYIDSPQRPPQWLAYKIDRYLAGPVAALVNP